MVLERGQVRIIGHQAVGAMQPLEPCGGVLELGDEPALVRGQRGRLLRTPRRATPPHAPQGSSVSRRGISRRSGAEVGVRFGTRRLGSIETETDERFWPRILRDQEGARPTGNSPCRATKTTANSQLHRFRTPSCPRRSGRERHPRRDAFAHDRRGSSDPRARRAGSDRVARSRPHRPRPQSRRRSRSWHRARAPLPGTRAVASDHSGERC